MAQSELHLVRWNGAIPTDHIGFARAPGFVGPAEAGLCAYCVETLRRMNRNTRELEVMALLPGYEALGRPPHVALLYSTGGVILGTPIERLNSRFWRIHWFLSIGKPEDA